MGTAVASPFSVCVGEFRLDSLTIKLLGTNHEHCCQLLFLHGCYDLTPSYLHDVETNQESRINGSRWHMSLALVNTLLYYRIER
jgi:hypothetical protein